MAEPPDEGFRVTDRRRRDTIEAPGASGTPSPPRPAAAFSPEGPHDAPHARNLVGLFVMLATQAVLARTSDHDAPGVEAQRAPWLGRDSPARADGQPDGPREPSRRQGLRERRERRLVQEAAERYGAHDGDEVVAAQPDRWLAKREVGGIEVSRDERVELGLAEHDGAGARAAPQETDDLLLSADAVLGRERHGLDDRRLEQANDRPPPGGGQQNDRQESDDRREAPPQTHGSNSTIPFP